MQNGELVARAERLQQQLREAQAAALLGDGDHDGSQAQEAAATLERELAEAREAAAQASDSHRFVVGEYVIRHSWLPGVLVLTPFLSPPSSEGPR